MNMQRWLGVGSLVLATFLYGSFGLLSRTVGYSIPLFYQNMTRGIVAALILGVVIVVMRTPWPKATASDWWWIAVRSVAGIVGFIGFFVAINIMSFGTSYFLFYGSSTVIGYVLGRVLFGEAVTRIKWISLGLAIFGLVLTYAEGLSKWDATAGLAAIIAGIGTAVWNVASKKISDRFTPSQLAFLDNVFPVAAYGLMSVYFREVWTVPDMSAPWVASNTLGVLYIITGILVVYGFSVLEAQTGSLVMLSEILFAIAVGFVAYGETLTGLTVFGGILILAAIALPNLERGARHARRLYHVGRRRLNRTAQRRRT